MKKPFGDIYYGWIIVSICLVSMFFGVGILSSFSVFYVALLEAFNWSRGNSAGVQSISLNVYTICAPIVGSLIDRYGPRKVITTGVLVLSSGLVLCSSIQNLTQFFLFYGLIVGAGITTIGIVSCSTIIYNWFENKRGLASGIALSGVGLGTFIIFFGIGWGGTAPLFMAVSSDLFGGRIFGLIYGLVEGGVGLAAAFGVWVAGYIFDETGSYKLAFVLAIITTILSITFIWLAAPRKAQAFHQKKLNLIHNKAGVMKA